MQAFSEERTKKGVYLKSYNVSSFDYGASVKVEYDDLKEIYECSVNVFSMLLLYDSARIAAEYR